METLAMPPASPFFEKLQTKRAACGILFAYCGIVGAAKEVVHGNLVEIRDFDEGSGGDVNIATLIIAVYPLTAGKNFTHFGLG